MSVVPGQPNTYRVARLSGPLGLDYYGALPEALSSASEEGRGTVLAGKQVLIVEDEFLVGTLIEDTLHSFGCDTIGPFTTLDLAMQASRQEAFDVAMLDINLGGKMVYPLADDLLARSIPFLFVTGYGFSEIPEPYRGVIRIEKPFNQAGIKKALEQVLSASH